MRNALTAILFTIICSLTAHGAQISAEEAVAKIQAVYARQCCFTAHFDQLTVNVAMDLRDKFQGVMYVKKPGLIMLDVMSPEKQKVLIQGRSYTVYFPEDGSASKGEIPPELNLEHFFGFFAEINKLDQNFTISVPNKAVDAAEELLFLELTDKRNKQGTYTIMIGVDWNTFYVRRAIIYDAMGNYNRFDLTSIKFPETIPDSQFDVTNVPRSDRTPSQTGKP